MGTGCIFTSPGRDREKCKRVHWGVKNSLHWVLDIGFREDKSRIRAGNAVENVNVLRHIGTNLLKQEKGCKMGIASKRKACVYCADHLQPPFKNPLAYIILHFVGTLLESTLFHRSPSIRFQAQKKTRNPLKSRLPALLPRSRCDRIRTCDLCVPNAALYQAEPRIVYQP